LKATAADDILLVVRQERADESQAPPHSTLRRRSARATTTILATRSAEARTKDEALIRTADKLLCESWNERTASRSARRPQSTEPKWWLWPA
jgi:hypothetical protein